ncbi:MAG: WecB/TagA/CpsF family glycosyltransferase [Deltaproteobacteria bacterium]|nr:WecB/TagA/CpsF family glycosyltransferase [Deltaproteobacteria bacterium]
MGVPVHQVSPAQVLAQVGAWIHEDRRATVGYVNAHVLELAQRDGRLMGWLRGLDLCYADGAGVVLAARLAGDALPGRMTGADWIWDLAAAAEREGWNLGWIGGRPGVVARAVARLRQVHPDLRVGLIDHGYRPRWSPVGINEAGLDVLLVGMGTPTQERWVAVHRGALEVPVVWALGATADFVSGEVDRGPPWLYRRAEWLARLWADPSRLAGRYLVGLPRFAARALWGGVARRVVER